MSTLINHSNGSYMTLSFAALSDLDLPCIDSVILSCQVREDDSDTLLEDLLLMWKILEEFVRKGQISSIGISDINTETFINLYDAVEVRFIWLLELIYFYFSSIVFFSSCLTLPVLI